MSYGVQFFSSPGGLLHGDALLALRDSGVTSFWVSDHLVGSSGRYHVDFGDPFVDLAAIAGFLGPDVALGTNLLIAPLYGTARLNRAAATLSQYTTRPLSIGMGVGWNIEDYRACNVDFGRRGRLLDKIIGDLNWLWGRSDGELEVSAEARTVHDTDSIRPCLTPRILVGGGRTANQATLSPRVAERIARSDGWLVNPHAYQQHVTDDLNAINMIDGSHVTSEADCIFSVVAHLPDPSTSRDDAIRQQSDAYSSFFGHERPPEHIRRIAAFGTVNEIACKITELAGRRAGEIIFMLVTSDAEQYRRLAELVKRISPRPHDGATHPLPASAH